jgi:hypothetical protein
MYTLYESEFMRADADPDRSILWIRRSALPFPSIDRARSENLAVAQKIQSLSLRFLILDSRQAPGRNDDDFESAMRPVFQSYVSRFERAVMLVQTAIGRLQMQRLSRTSPIPVGVCTNDEEALAFLGKSR